MRGTPPLGIFGPKDYGYRLGFFGAPARIAQAAAPLAFSVLIDQIGGRVLIFSSSLEPSGFDRAMRGAQPGSVERAPAGLIRRRAARRPGRGAGDPERAGAASAARPSKMA